MQYCMYSHHQNDRHHFSRVTRFKIQIKIRGPVRTRVQFLPLLLHRNFYHNSDHMWFMLFFFCITITDHDQLRAKKRKRNLVFYMWGKGGWGGICTWRVIKAIDQKAIYVCITAGNKPHVTVQSFFFKRNGCQALVINICMGKEGTKKSNMKNVEKMGINILKY